MHILVECESEEIHFKKLHLDNTKYSMLDYGTSYILIF